MLMERIGEEGVDEEMKGPNGRFRSCRLSLLPLFASETLVAACNAAGVTWRRVLTTACNHGAYLLLTPLLFVAVVHRVCAVAWSNDVVPPDMRHRIDVACHPQHL